MKTEHTTIRNQKLFCQNCGGEFALVFPLAIPIMSQKIKAFNALHKDCLPTWQQPVVDQTKTIQEKMDFWLNFGEHGRSSETMFQQLSGKPMDSWGCHPQDPDDFKRCHGLLETIPEWRNELDKLRPLSPTWNLLVDNWNILTKMLVDQLNTKKPNGMHEFMQAIFKKAIK